MDTPLNSVNRGGKGLRVHLLTEKAGLFDVIDSSFQDTKAYKDMASAIKA